MAELLYLNHRRGRSFVCHTERLERCACGHIRLEQVSTLVLLFEDLSAYKPKRRRCTLLLLSCSCVWYGVV